MNATTLALVGATGGAGTTRTAIELAAVGARGGRDVAVIDAAFTTQGLSEYVRGRIGTDLTSLVTDDADASLSAATYPIAVDEVGDGADAETPTPERADDGATDAGTTNGLPGRADVVPARAPFERVARAKTAEAARKLERRVDEAATTYDAVIVDAAPVGSNEAVAAVTTVDRVGAVRPATPHGRDALQRLRGRVADVGGSVDTTVAVRRGADAETDEASSGIDLVIPPTDPAMASAPTAANGSDEYVRAVGEAYARLFDTALDIEFEDDGLIERLRD